MKRIFAVYLVVMFALPALPFGGSAIRAAYILLPLIVFMLAIAGLMRRSLLSSLRIPSVLFLFIYTLNMTIPFTINKPYLLPEATNFLLYWYALVGFAVLFSDHLLTADAGVGKVDDFLEGVTKALVLAGMFMVFIGVLELIFPAVVHGLYSSKGEDARFGGRALGFLGTLSRISSTAGAPNTLGEVMSIFSLLALVQLTVGKATGVRSKAVFAAFVASLLMSGSRGAVAGFIAGFGCLLFIGRRFKYFAVTLFVALGIYLLAGDIIMDFFSQGNSLKHGTYEAVPASLGNRIRIWQVAFAGWRSSGLVNLVFGNGYYNERLHQMLGLYGWHNSYLQVAYAGGFVGAMIVGSFIVFSMWGLKIGLDMTKESAAMKNGYSYMVFVTVAYVSVLVHSIVDNVFLDNTIIMAMFLPIFCIAMVIAYKMRKDEALQYG